MLRRARAKDNRGKGVESSAVNMVQKKNSFASCNKKKKNMQENNNANLSRLHSLRRKTTRKVEDALFVGVMSIGQVRAQTANISKKRNQKTW